MIPFRRDFEAHNCLPIHPISALPPRPTCALQLTLRSTPGSALRRRRRSLIG